MQAVELPQAEVSPDATASGLPPDALLDSGQIAALFKVNRSTVTTWAQEGRLPRPVRIGRTLRWPRRVILELLGA